MTKRAFDIYGISYVNCKECKHFKFVNTESCKLKYDLYPRTCNYFVEDLKQTTLV